jgi:hypothetical protein
MQLFLVRKCPTAGHRSFKGYDTHRLIAPSYQQHMHMDDEHADQKA